MDEGVIRCVCGNESDDGFTIQCDGCKGTASFEINLGNTWQHAACLQITKQSVPDEYLCDICLPPPKKKRGEAFHVLTEDYIVIHQNLEPLQEIDAPVEKVLEYPPEALSLEALQLQWNANMDAVGVFATNTIPATTFIQEFTGHVIRRESGAHGPFQLVMDSNILISAQTHGNRMRFIRHAVNANCKAVILKVNGFYQLWIQSQSEILAGKELTVHCLSCTFVDDETVSVDGFRELVQNTESTTKKTKKSASNESLNISVNTESNNGHLSREERKIRDELRRFAKMESEKQKKDSPKVKPRRQPAAPPPLQVTAPPVAQVQPLLQQAQQSAQSTETDILDGPRYPSSPLSRSASLSSTFSRPVSPLDHGGGFRFKPLHLRSPRPRPAEQENEDVSENLKDPEDSKMDMEPDPPKQEETSKKDDKKPLILLKKTFIPALSITTMHAATPQPQTRISFEEYKRKRKMEASVASSPKSGVRELVEAAQLRIKDENS